MDQDMVKSVFHVTGIGKELRAYFEMLVPYEYERMSGQGDFLLGAVDERWQPCGVLWYSFYGTEYEIRSILVHPSFRRRGVATLMLQSFLGSLYKTGMVYPVRINFVSGKDTEVFRKFLDRQGNFYYLEPDHFHVISAQSRSDSEQYRLMKQRHSDAVPFFEQSLNMRKVFLMQQHKQGLHFVDDIFMDRNDYDRKLCFCKIVEDRITAAVFMKHKENGNRELSYLYADDGKTLVLRSLLSAVANACDNICPDKDIEIQTVNAASEKLVNGLFWASDINEVEIVRAIWDMSVRES